MNFSKRLLLPKTFKKGYEMILNECGMELIKKIEALKMAKEYVGHIEHQMVVFQYSFHSDFRDN